MRGFLRAIKVARILRDQYPRKKTNSLKWVWLSTSCLLIHSSPILFPAADVQLPVFVFPSLMTCFFSGSSECCPKWCQAIYCGEDMLQTPPPSLEQPLGVGRKIFQLSQLLGTVYLRWFCTIFEAFPEAFKPQVYTVVTGLITWLLFAASPSLYHFPMAPPVSCTSQINHFCFNTYLGSASKAAQLMIHKLHGGWGCEVEQKAAAMRQRSWKEISDISQDLWD